MAKVFAVTTQELIELELGEELGEGRDVIGDEPDPTQGEYPEVLYEGRL